jgi:hypothetical protein
MEGSARMVVVGVGLNSQVGNIMSLLGATAGGKDSKKKKKKTKKEKLPKKDKKQSLETNAQGEMGKLAENVDEEEVAATESKHKCK